VSGGKSTSEARHMQKSFVARLAFLLVIALIAAAIVAVGAAFFHDVPYELQFVVTSDAHYGLRRATFRGHANVDAQVVNQALVAKLNRLADVRFPLDSGLSEGRPVGGVDFIVEAGDITNREEHTDELTWVL